MNRSGTNYSTVWWAVYLGCTTPMRLAREWKITLKQAADLLCRAHAARKIRRVSRGVFSV